MAPNDSPAVGIVGCGSIGRAIVRSAAEGRLRARIGGVASRTREPAEAFMAGLPEPPPLLERGELLETCDLIVEAAGGHVVDGLAREAFAKGRSLMVISIGALLDHPELFDLARESGCDLILPSGAIVGLDGVKAACTGRVDYVTLTSRKPPRALKGAPFLLEHGISLDDLAEPRLLFKGPARDAVRGFPDNLNISAALSFAGIGPDRTEVSITADPSVQRNCHDIAVEGEFGLFRVHLENIPGENPKTGRLTSLSIVRAINDYMDRVRIGT